MAEDRTGIIHAVSQALLDMGGDLADIRQQVLQGYFSMILYSGFPAGVSAEEIRHRLQAIDARSPFEVAVKPMVSPGTTPPLEEKEIYVLTARGDDRPGFVCAVSGLCARHGVNILDLSTTRQKGTYTMILLLDLQGCPDLSNLRQEMRKFSDQEKIDLLLQHHDIFKATNEVAM